MSKQGAVVAIDGPAGSGKTTIAAALARRLGYSCVSTGNMFRAVAMLSCGSDESAVAVARNAVFSFELKNTSFRTIVNGDDLTRQISSPRVIPGAARVAALPEVREALLNAQRSLAADGGVVMEGRDIGTVVLPSADWKFFLDADDDVRATRLYRLLSKRERERYGSVESYGTVLKAVDSGDRDRLLKSARSATLYRRTGPLTSHEEALILWYYITYSRELLDNCSRFPSRA